MGRHEIRFRRKMMTSRRIESHKDYYDLLRKHERARQGKKLFKLFLLILIILGLFVLSFIIYRATNSNPGDNIEEITTEIIKDKTWPGTVYFEQNNENYGKT